MLHLAVRQDILAENPPHLPVLENFNGSVSRQVQFSEVDFYGHVNNTRYLDWCLDAIPAAWHHSHKIRCMIINFLSETHYGENIRVDYLMSEDSILFQGNREADGKAIYRAELRIL